MAQLQKNPNSQVGAKPTAAQKLGYVSSKLGIPGITAMQGSSVNIVDTVILQTNASRQTLSFFNACGSKSRNFSNFQQGKLPSGGTLVIEKMSFIYLLLTTANLNDDTNVIIAATPLSGVAAALMPLNFGLVNLTIANQKPLVDFSIFESFPAYNPSTTGISTFNAAPMGQNTIPLEAPPVLPTNQGLQLDLQVPPLTAPAFSAVMCVLGRFGSIYASKSTL